MTPSLVEGWFLIQTLLTQRIDLLRPTLSHHCLITQSLQVDAAEDGF